MRAIILSTMALVFLTACGGDRPLRNMDSGSNGPDEFAVIPQRPLTLPDTAVLPEPTPGGSNRADPNPTGDAIIALGGSQSATTTSKDNALVTQAGRHGVDPTIRAQLAAEDEAFRQRKRRTNFFNPLGRDRYFPAYARQALDAQAELTRLRTLGISVPNQPVPQAQAQTQVDTQNVDQRCVFTTAGPGNQLRRVCTPVGGEER